MTEERKTYCRACGENKGHNFSQCKNVAGLRQIIRLQDPQIEDRMKNEKRIEELEQQLGKANSDGAYVSRVLQALLFSFEKIAMLKRA